LGKISKALEKAETGSIKPEHHAGSRIKTVEPKIDHAVPESTRKQYTGNNKRKGRPEDKPSLPPQIAKTLVSILTPDSAESEQFRLLKNNILFPETGLPPRSIMVTSPSPGEGKSFVAANLAASIAQNIDEHVLLMDCDLRKPTIHSMFGIGKTRGLSDYLKERKPLSSLLQKTFIDKLTILPAGHIPSNPSELLSSGLMRNLIHEMTARYQDRYIIVDTPPPYITSEAGAIARQVDGIILVIKHGKTRKKDVENVIEIYGKDKIIGVVQNFAEKRPGYGYGYYKYGYGYYGSKR